MFAIARILPPGRPLLALAPATLIAGVSGMVLSFLYLASANQLDVIAGAAGFVAGSVLVAGSLISISIRLPFPPTPDSISPPVAVDAPLAVNRWLAHFRRNQANRLEPDWNAPMTLAAEVVRPLVRSLEQFQLGDGGGPAYLIARDRERFLTQAEGMRELVDRWFLEEREHSRLLGAALVRFGGHPIQGHWSFTAFCLSRKWFGVGFELTVLLLTEIASTVYYRLLRRHGQDSALRSMCRLIIRDEVGHVAFHRDRLAHAARAGRSAYGLGWELCFRVLGLAAASMLWVNHFRGLTALGAGTAEFYREVWQELSRFIRRLRREASAGE